MPCDTERTISVDLKVADDQLLAKALAARGFYVDRLRPGTLTLRRIEAKAGEVNSAVISDGQIEVSAGSYGYIADEQATVEKFAGEVKRAYAAEAVKTAAAKYGWSVATPGLTSVAEKKNANHFQLHRRTY